MLFQLVVLFIAIPAFAQQDNPVAAPPMSSAWSTLKEGSLTFINRNLSFPRFTKKIKNGWLEIKTSALTLRYKIETESFNTRNLRIDYFHKGKRQTWNIDRVNAGNLKGTTRTLDRCEGNVLYLSITKDTLQLEDGIDFWWLDWQ